MKILYCDEDVKGKFEVFAGDICDPNGVRTGMKGYEAVLHLAALIAIPPNTIPGRSAGQGVSLAKRM